MEILKNDASVLSLESLDEVVGGLARTLVDDVAPQTEGPLPEGPSGRPEMWRLSDR